MSMWQRPGWLAEILPAVDGQLARHGLTRMGRPVQVRQTSVTGLFRIPTDNHPVWLKAVPPMFAHEPAVIHWISGTAAGRVPEVLARGPLWWIAVGFPAERSDPREDFLLPIADMQIASISRISELRLLGCPDRPLSSSVQALSSLAKRPGLLPSEDWARLRASLPAVARLCEEVEALRFPPTLVHGDLHSENVRWTGEGWLIFDWTDSCISHPFIDLAMPLTQHDEGIGQRRAAAYAAAWSGLMPRAAIDRALRAAPVLGAAHQAASYQRILDGIGYPGGDVSTGDELLGWLRHWIAALDPDRRPASSVATYWADQFRAHVP